MKIVHVLPSLARGGGERLMIELANREAAAGHEVSVVAAYPVKSDEAHSGLSKTITLIYLSNAPARGVRSYAKLLPWVRRNSAWIKQQDLIHCHLTWGAAFGTVVRLVLGRERPAIVETYHAVGMPIPRWHRWLHARMAASREGLSFMVEDPYWDRFRDRHRDLISRVIPVGVDAPDVGKMDEAARQAYLDRVGIPAGAPHVVGTIGRLSPDRQQHRYVPVFQAIARELGADVHFLMGGDGPDRDRIATEIRAANLADRVHLPGLVKDLEEPMSVMDLYITSNVGSVPGVAGLQAVAAGLPVIAIQLVDRFKPSPADWIWSSPDHEEVAREGTRLLRSPDERMHLAARQKAYLDARHSPRAMAESYLKLYQEVIARRRRKRPSGPIGQG